MYYTKSIPFLYSLLFFVKFKNAPKNDAKATTHLLYVKKVELFRCTIKKKKKKKTALAF